jgi:hypothetical protein
MARAACSPATLARAADDRRRSVRFVLATAMAAAAARAAACGWPRIAPQVEWLLLFASKNGGKRLADRAWGAA